jgi:hypothetical protein
MQVKELIKNAFNFDQWVMHARCFNPNAQLKL